MFTRNAAIATLAVCLTAVPCARAHAQAVPPGYFNVKSYGAAGDGMTDDTGAITAAIAAAAAAVSPSGAQGGVVYFPTGQYQISSTIDLPNRVALHGPNGRGAVVQAINCAKSCVNQKGFGGTGGYLYMFHAYRVANGKFASIFGSRIQDMELDFNDVAIPGSAIIEADSWQESDGLERVVLYRFGQYGMIIANGGGGAAYLPLKDIEVFGSANGSVCGIKVGSIGLYGAFILSIDGGTFSGGTVLNPDGSVRAWAQLPIGIQLQDTLVAKGLHFEQTTIGISHYGNGGLSIDTATGASPNSNGGTVGTLIELGAQFTGVLNVRNLIGNGISGPLVTNDVTGVNISGGSGRNLAEYVLDMQSTVPPGAVRSALY